LVNTIYLSYPFLREPWFNEHFTIEWKSNVWFFLSKDALIRDLMYSSFLSKLNALGQT